MSIETIVHGRTKLNFVGCCLKEGRKEGRKGQETFSVLFWDFFFASTWNQCVVDRWRLETQLYSLHYFYLSNSQIIVHQQIFILHLNLSYNILP
jgi:hypothetical protein